MYLRNISTAALVATGLLMSHHCHAGDDVPSPFISEDTWEYEQVKKTPGKQKKINPSITFKVAKLAETWIAHAVAITDDKVPIWDLKWKLPRSRCIQDFLGQSDLGLTDSCIKPLSVGRTWNAEAADGDTKSALKNTVESDENITVQAGRFDTVKIVQVGEIYRNGGGLIATVKRTFWFSYKAKAFVRVVHEYTTPTGKIGDVVIEELKSYKVSAH